MIMTVTSRRSLIGLCLLLACLMRVPGSSLTEERVVDDFAHKFMDEDEDVRRATIDDCFRVVRHNPELAGRTLLPLLKHPDQQVRYSAAVVLQMTAPGSSYAIPELFDLLMNPKEGRPVRDMAAVALGAIGTAGVVDRLSSLCERSDDRITRMLAIQSLCRIQDHSTMAARTLLREIDRGNDEYSSFAVECLTLMGPSVAPEVETIYVRLPLASRCRLLKVLLQWERVSSEAASVTLVEGLRSNSSEAAECAADCSYSIPHPSPELIEELGRSLGSPSVALRRYCSLSLFRHRTHSHMAASPIIRALSDSDAEVRRNVASSLPWLGDSGSRAAHQLVPLLTDPCEDVCFAAASSLEMMGPQATDAVPALLKMRTSSIVDRSLIDRIIRRIRVPNTKRHPQR